MYGRGTLKFIVCLRLRDAVGRCEDVARIFELLGDFRMEDEWRNGLGVLLSLYRLMRLLVLRIECFYSSIFGIDHSLCQEL